MPEIAVENIKYPRISKMPRMMVKSSDHEFIRKDSAEFKSNWISNEEEFRWMFQAWKFAFGGDGEQWDYEAWKYKKQRGIRAGQYNFIGQKVDTYTGAIIADRYDIKYDPVDGERNSGIRAIEDAYYTDKERCGYDVQWNLFVQDAVIHLGVLECKVGTKYDRRGNIYFERALPGRWVFDSYWKTDDDVDCRRSWKHWHSTIEQMFEIFGSLPSTPQLDELIKKRKKLGMSWTERQIDEYNRYDPTFNDAYHIVESHWVECLKTKRLIYYDDFGNPILFPVTEDNEKLEQFAQQAGITEWQDRVDMVPYEDKIHHSAAYCQELFPYTLLEYGKPEVQTQSLPTIQLTMHRDPSGRNKGVPHDLIDAQKDVNYNKSKVHEYLANALGGAVVYDKRLMPNESDQQDFEQNRNDNSRAFGLDGDPSRFMSHVTDAQPNNQVVQQISESVDFMDRISGKSAAMESQTQGSNEPAALYEMKLKVDKIGDLPVLNRVKRSRTRQAEMYFLQAQITYKDTERSFTSKDGKRKSTLNEKVTFMGRPAIKNSVEDLPLCSVTISEAPDNLTKNIRTQTELSMMLKSVPPEYRETIAIIIGELFKATHIPDDKKLKIEQAVQLETVSARIAKMAEISTMDTTMAQNSLMSAQFKAQLQQLMSDIGGQPQGGMEEQVPDMITPDEEGPMPEQVSVQEEAPMMEGAEPMVPEQGMTEQPQPMAPTEGPPA